MANNLEPEQLLMHGSSPYGISREKWTEKWWQWLYAIPRPENPANDSTGGSCARNQKEPNVWFLVGTLGGIVERHCVIPEKAILFPIITSARLLSELGFRSESELDDKVSKEADSITEMSLKIDGMGLTDLRKHRIHTKPFDVTLPQDNIWSQKSGPNRAAADGYWIFLKPLSAGKHTVEFFGSDLDGFETGVTYKIAVKS